MTLRALKGSTSNYQQLSDAPPVFAVQTNRSYHVSMLRGGSTVTVYSDLALTHVVASFGAGSDGSFTAQAVGDNGETAAGQTGFGTLYVTAIDALAKVTGHADDDVYLAALTARGYQAVRAAARALAGSSRKNDVLLAALTSARRLRVDSSETSRDTRLSLLERIGENADVAHARAIADLAYDFDCMVAQAAATIAARFGPTTGMAPRCTRPPVRLPADAVALALGKEVRLRVVLADSSAFGFSPNRAVSFSPF